MFAAMMAAVVEAAAMVLLVLVKPLLVLTEWVAQQGGSV